MKIVIDIDEKDYEFIKSVNFIMKNSDTFQRIAADLFRATQDGTPLPRCHGDLIDRDILLQNWKVIPSRDRLIFDRYIQTLNGVIPVDK